MLKFFITSILLITTQAFVCAQNQDSVNVANTADSAIAKLDSSKLFIPTGLRIGTDVISIIKTNTKDNYSNFTISADIDFYKYFLNFEYGRYSRSKSNTSNTASYNLKGSYFRVGPDINLLYKDPDKSALFFGARYAFANFSDDLDYDIEDESGYPNSSRSLSESNRNAKWFELVGGLKVNLWKYFWLGYTARFKFGATKFEDQELIPGEIPGFGPTSDKVAWDFNYWLIFRIPFKKDQPIPTTE